MTGFVSFVSSGPGDPELLTLKAVARLQSADAILFDQLSAGPILTHARSGAQLIDVGKRAGRPSPTQAEINQRLVEHASSGKRVVRLKSGDAGIFGRLEEEISALGAAGISYEIIPGVSSACAAAAAAGMPLTRRLTSRRVQFVTGHDVTGALPDGLNMAALADPTATTAVYMGRRTFTALAVQLIAAGLPASTPALLAESVSRAEQHLTRSTVAGLAAALATVTSHQPALILYGALCDEPH
jgi:uroporphyrin-III C-methyltransferase